MIVTKRVIDVCTSNADDYAYLALRDLATISEEHTEFRIVGGHMVNLIRLAFPVIGTIERRTTDADAAIGVQIATDGRIHEQLTLLGYQAESGNRYVFEGRTVDLLVPSGTGRFTQQLHGDRMFDAAPGLILSPEAPHIVVSVDVTLTTGETLTILVRLPTLERAVILKTYALASRNAAKDLVDLYNLFTIARAHSDTPEEIGGWKLGEPVLAGTRKDAARILARTLRTPATRRRLEGSGASPARLQALAHALIPGILTGNYT